MPPAARVSDMHTCPMVNGTVPHVGGPILPPGCPTVMIGFLLAARVGDMATCAGPPDTIVKGSPTVMIGGMPAARVGDMTTHGGVITLGHVPTMIGDAGSGGGGGGAGGGGGGGDGGGAEQAESPQPDQSPSDGTPASSDVASAAFGTQMQNAADSGAALCEVCPAPPPVESIPPGETPNQEGPSAGSPDKTEDDADTPDSAADSADDDDWEE